MSEGSFTKQVTCESCGYVRVEVHYQGCAASSELSRLRASKEAAEGMLAQYKQDHADILGRDWVPREYYDDARSSLCAKHGGTALSLDPAHDCKKCLKEAKEAAEAALCRAKEGLLRCKLWFIPGEAPMALMDEINDALCSSAPCPHAAEVDRLTKERDRLKEAVE